MKLPRFLFLIFVHGISATAGDPTGFFEEYGSGICKEERMEQLKKQEQNCMEQADFFNTTLIQDDWKMDEWCTHLENILKCWDNYTECYNPEEMKELNSIILEFTIEYIHEKFGKIRQCPIYLELINDSFPPDWYIFPIIGGVIYLIFGIVTAVQKFKKNNIRRLN